MNHHMPVGLSGLEHRAWEIGLVRSIRKILGLQAECGAMRVCGTILAGFEVSLEIGGTQEISAVKLNRWLVRGNLHDPAALRIPEPRSEGEAVRLRLGQHPAMIVASAQLQGFESFTDTRADGMG